VTTKADFNADEWSRVQLAPFVAGFTVITADRGGTLRETVEMARVYAEERQDADAPELIREIVSSQPAVDAQQLGGGQQAGGAQQQASPEDARARSQEVIRDAVGILEAKASPEELDAYKRFCLEIAERVAERTKSGGVLGVGGKSVSDAEQAALDELGATLGIAPEAGAGTA